MQKTTNRARSIAILLVGVLLLVSLAGCANNNQGDPNATVNIGSTSVPNNQGGSESQQPVEVSATPADSTVMPTEIPANTPETNETPEPFETATPEQTAVQTASPTPTSQATPTPTPTPAPTPTPTPAPASSAPSTNPPSGGTVVSIGTSTMPARFTMPTDLYGVSVSNCEQWFSDAVFVGDSLTLGWQNYVNKMMESNPNFFGRTHFLCSGSYGVGHAFDPISDESLHPRYQGEQHYVWDSIHMMGANKVFILLGLNDISIYGVDGTFAKYCELVSTIISHRPGVQIYIISDMYMYRGSERERLNNRNLYLLNQHLAQYCRDNGFEFINIASHLIDENGFVPDQYSSDHYVHQTYAAYAIWADILRSVAARHIKGLPPIVFSMP